MQEEQLILVNENDEPIGVCAKLEAHQKALLHRAFSIFIFDSKGQMLLQQRSLQKYHGGGLWTNACCSHPHPHEETLAAAQRRLYEELGFETPLEKIFQFTYKAAVENDLTEHELDHVFAGEHNGEIVAAPEEVNDYCYQSMAEIEEAIALQPEKFTTWFRIAFPRVKRWWQQHYIDQQKFV